MTKSDSDVLDEAADFIEKYGWIQGEYGAEERGYCTVGTIWAADGGANSSVGGPANVFNKYMLKNYPGIYFNIPQWNDAPGRTKEEVISTLRKVAAHVGVPQGS